MELIQMHHSDEMSTLCEKLHVKKKHFANSKRANIQQLLDEIIGLKYLTSSAESKIEESSQSESNTQTHLAATASIETGAWSNAAALAGGQRKWQKLSCVCCFSTHYFLTHGCVVSLWFLFSIQHFLAGCVLTTWQGTDACRQFKAQLMTTVCQMVVQCFAAWRHTCIALPGFCGSHRSWLSCLAFLTSVYNLVSVIGTFAVFPRSDVPICRNMQFITCCLCDYSC